EGGAALEAVEAPPGAQERLLHGVLRLERRGEHAVAVAGQLAPVVLEALIELLPGHTRRQRRISHRGHASEREGPGRPGPFALHAADRGGSGRVLFSASSTRACRRASRATTFAGRRGFLSGPGTRTRCRRIANSFLLRFLAPAP